MKRIGIIIRSLEFYSLYLVIILFANDLLFFTLKNLKIRVNYESIEFFLRIWPRTLALIAILGLLGFMYKKTLYNISLTSIVVKLWGRGLLLGFLAVASLLVIYSN